MMLRQRTRLFLMLQQLAPAVTGSTLFHGLVSNDNILGWDLMAHLMQNFAV